MISSYHKDISEKGAALSHAVKSLHSLNRFWGDVDDEEFDAQHKEIEKEKERWEYMLKQLRLVWEM